MASSGDAQPQRIMSKITAQQIQKNGKLGWRLRLRDPKLSGKQPERTFYGSHSEAIIALNEMSKTLAKGEVLPLTRGRGTVAEAAEIWLKTYKWKGKPTLVHTGKPDRPQPTWHKAKVQVHTYILPILGPNLRLSALTAEAVDNVVTTLAAQKLVKDPSRTLSPSSVQTTVSVMKSMFRDLHKMRLTPKNYAESLQGNWSATVKQNELKIPTEVELNKLAEALESEWPGHGAIIQFLAHTGWRFEEFAALTWTDIDFTNNAIQVLRTATESGGKRFISTELKTTSSRREVILLEPAKTALGQLKEALVRSRGERELVNVDDWSRIVNSQKGGYISYSQWRKHLAKARISSGVDITAHDLRHIYASSLLATGASVELVSNQLGHSNSRITLAVYRHHIALNRTSESKAISEKLRQMHQREVSPESEG